MVPFFKIASADITNIPFLRKVAGKGKPVVLSTGASNKEEIEIALDTIHQSGCRDVALLHCILNYPTDYDRAHLKMITDLINSYPDNVIGYSDHTLPNDSMTSLTSAFLLGAAIIEKHFTNDKKLQGNDHYHAMDKQDLKKTIELINKIRISLGQQFHKAPIETEQISRLNARRSIVLKQNVYKGDTLTEDNLTYKRPGTGISPLNWDEVIGKKVISDLQDDHILQWSDIQTD
jgi:Sialic acid synthase